MNRKLAQLAERRRYLIDQSEAQRYVVRQVADRWRPVLARADQGIATLHYLKSHPLWLVGGGAALLVLIGPGRVWHMLGRGLLGLQMLRRLRIW